MDIFECFGLQYQDFYAHKIDRINCCNEFVNQALLAHRLRLDKHNYWLAIKSPRRTADLILDFHREDAKYECIIHSDRVKYSKTLVRDGKGIVAVTGDKIRYITSVDKIVKDYHENENVNCPNCGVASTVFDLRGGCKFCGTSFDMTDLFPSVANQYFVDDMYVAPEDAKTGLGRYLKAYSKIGTLMVGAAKALNQFSIVGNSLKEYENFMMQYRPDFTYQYFSSQAIHMISLMLFSDNPSDLPFNTLDIKTPLIPQLIDYDFEGFGIYNKQYSVNSNIASVTTIMFANAYYDVDGEIKKRNDKYIVTLERDISTPINYGFSMSAINCSSCGAVFDAFKSSSCPYCSTKYVTSNRDWVVTSFKRE